MDGMFAKLLRSAVLLGFLLILPAYALFDRWPAELKELAQEWIPALVGSKDEPRMANRFEAPVVEAPDFAAQPESQRRAALDVREAVATASDEIRPLTVPTDEESPLKSAERLASGEGRKLRAPVYRPLATGDDQPVISRIPVPSSETVAAPTSAPGPGRSQVESRLQQLGAHYYRLDADAATGGYRFFCEFPAADGPQGLRRFEAVEANELTAMHRVLADAEAWQQSRLR